MKKQVLSLALSATMLASMLPKPAFAADNTSTFPDMPSDWSTQALQNAVNNGLLNGIDGKIAAGENLTRAQMAAIVTRAFGTNGKANISSFGDVNAGDWFYDAMASSVLMGAFQGDGVNLNPNANITRQEAFTVLARLFTLSGGDQSVLSSYTDGAQVADWAKDSMASMVAAGYVKGSDNMLNPRSSITRAEFAQVMDNLVKTYFADNRLNVNANGNAVLNKAGTLEGATISGDLIIGDGAAEGDVVLKDVTVSGRLLVRGGGTSTVTLGGNTTVGSIAVNKPTGAVRVKNNTQKTVNVNALSDNVVLTGDFNEVNANASQGTVTLTGADVATMNVAGTSAKVVVSEKSTVETMNVQGSASGAAVSVQSGTTVNTMNTAASKAVVTVNGTVNTMSVAGSDTTVKAEEGATIEKVTTSAANTTVSGKGSVANFEAAKGSSGADITTDGTKVVNNGTGNVTTGNDKVIGSGSTGASKSDSTTPGGGSSTGGGGGSSVDTVAPTVQSMAIDGVEVANGSTYYFGGDKTAFKSLTATMSENVSLVGETGTVQVRNSTGEGQWNEWADYATFTVGEDKKTLNIDAVNHQGFAAGTFQFQVAAGTLKDAAGNKNAALSWEITFASNASAPVTTEAQLKDALNGGVKAVNMSEDITITSDMTVQNATTLTIEEGKTLTVAAGVTLTNNGTITEETRVKGATVTLGKVTPTFSKYVKSTGIKVWVDDTAGWVKYAEQTSALRDNGPGKPGTESESNFDYPGAYTEAGVTWSGSTFTVDQAKTNEFVGNAEKNSNKINQLTQPSGELNGGNGLFVGVKFETSSVLGKEKGSVYVFRNGKNLNGNNNAYQLNPDSVDGTGGDVYLGAPVNYLLFAKADSDKGLANKEWNYVFVWQDENGKAVEVSYCTVSRKVITTDTTDTKYVTTDEELKSALEGAYTTVVVNDNITTTENLTVNAGVTLTVNSGKILTVGADKTLTLNAAVTGTIEGTSHTSKLVIGEGITYGELVAGEYVWNVDTSAWVKTPATEDNTLPTEAEWESISSYTLTQNYTLTGGYRVPKDKTLVIGNGITLTIGESGGLDVYNAALSGEGSVVVNNCGVLHINANYNGGEDSKVPTVSRITVNHGGTLISMPTNYHDEGNVSEIYFVCPISNDKRTRIQTTEGASVTFELGNFGKENKPKMIISGNVTIQEGQTWYSMFDSGEEAIGIDMTLKSGKMTVDGDLKIVSANKTGSSLTINKDASVLVNGTMSVAAKGVVKGEGSVTGAESATLTITKGSTVTAIAGVDSNKTATYTWFDDAWTTGK